MPHGDSNHGRRGDAGAAAHQTATLFVGTVSGVDFTVAEAKELVERLFVGADVPYCSVEVAEFGDSYPRKKRDAEKHHRGFCLVTVLCQDVDIALQKLQGASVASRAVRVQLAKPEDREGTDAERAKAKSAEEVQRSRAHNLRQQRRRKDRHAAGIAAALASLPEPGGITADSCFTSLESLRDMASASHAYVFSNALQSWAVPWDELPAVAVPSYGDGSDSVRARRKRHQVESFAFVLNALLGGLRAPGHDATAAPVDGDRVTVVDFGSGSGSLALPLAGLFPSYSLHCVDRNDRAIGLLRENAANCGLSNIVGHDSSIEGWAPPAGTRVDACLALHCCGLATDFAIERAIEFGAVFIACPCCVGKINARGEQDVSERGQIGPRSHWMRGRISTEQYAGLAQLADVTHGESRDTAREGRQHPYTELARACKANLELDRAQHARECGYTVLTLRLLAPEVTAKNHLLVGIPQQRMREMAPRLAQWGLLAGQ